jgi:hypothetical protein
MLQLYAYIILVGASQLIGKGVVINLAYHLCTLYSITGVHCTVFVRSTPWSTPVYSRVLYYSTRYVPYNEVHNVHCCTGVQYCKSKYCTDVQYCTTDSPEYLYLVHCVCVTEYDHSGVLYTVEQIYPST